MAIKLLAGAVFSALAAVAPMHADAAQKSAPRSMVGPKQVAVSPLQLSRIDGGAVGADPIVNGTYVYYPTGRVLATWNYANPDAPLRVSTSLPVAGGLNSLARKGNYLYASWRGYDGTSGVATYSLANPAQPKLISDTDDYVASSAKYSTGLVVANDHLYLFDNNHGMLVSDLADPARPVFAQTDIRSTDLYRRLVANGNLIQAVGRGFLSDAVLDLYDVSTPDAPVKLAHHSVDGFDSFKLVPEGGQAIGIGNQLSVFDVSDPTQMIKRSYLDIPPAVNGVRVGSHFYTFGYGAGMDLWDLSNLDAPAAAGHLDIAALGGNSAVKVGDTLLLQTNTDLVHAIDVSDPAAPTRRSTGWLKAGVGARDIATYVDKRPRSTVLPPRHLGAPPSYLVLLQPNYGLTINDRDTLAPLARFEADLPESLEQRSFEQMIVSGTTAYLAAWGYGLISVDLSNPAKPVELGRAAFPFAAVLDVKGSYAYVAKWTNGGLLAVADIRNPAAPEFVWQGELSGQPYRLKIDREYAYIAEGADSPDSGGLRVLDLTNPAAPSQLSQLDDQCGTAFDIVIDSAMSLAYLACQSELQVIDIANPAAPVVVGRYDAGAPNDYTRVAQRGNRAWFTNLAGLHELDVSDPTHPVLRKITSIGHQGAERLAAMSDSSLHVLGGGTGVQVFKTPLRPRGVLQPVQQAPVMAKPTHR